MLLALCWGGPASAQRAGENAVTAASDAFGTRVGNESIGLYGSGDARGFSPIEAGNVRIEGLYFDQQTPLNSRVARGSTVRVGIGAQSYAFPAPTGIADFNLRLPGEKQVVSAVATYGPYATYGLEVDGQFPLVANKLSIGLGISSTLYDNDLASKNRDVTLGAVVRWRPQETIEVLGFGSFVEDCHYAQQPFIFTAGPYLPPRYRLHRLYAQDWTRGDCHDSNAGVLTRVVLPDDWTIRAGVFHSGSIRHRAFGDILRAVQPDGTGQHIIFGLPRQSVASVSGEVRVAKLITEGLRRHTIDATLRGRDVERRFGGADVRNFGIATVGVRTVYPEPTFNFGPVTDDHTRQTTAGIAYGGQWAGVGEIGFGLQKAHYKRSIAEPARPVVKSRARPWLYNATANFFPAEGLAVYAGYTRGLEESGVAPPSSANRGEAMPASLTEQVDAGFRYAITPRLRFVAGVFQVEKPYFNLNAANVFGPLGAVRHRGIEVSLTGRLLDGLTVVGGAVFLEPRLSGDAVDRGLVGRIPVGPKPRNALVSMQYLPPAWRGFGIDGQVVNSSAQMAHFDNQLKIPPATVLNLGARYNFKVSEVPAAIRAQVLNVADAYGWNVAPSATIFAKSPRRFFVTLTADF